MGALFQWVISLAIALVGWLAFARMFPGAADLLVHLISDDVVRPLTRSGYLVPANQQVALSEDFLQPAQEPAHASVFNSAVRSMVLPPFLDDYAALDERVAGPAPERGLRRIVLLEVSLPDEIVDFFFNNNEKVISKQELDETVSK